jgi:hypothetical protein
LRHGHHIDGFGQFFQLGQRQFQGFFDKALDAQPVAVAIDAGGQAAPVIAHEKRVVGGNRALIEDAERRFQLGRTAGQQDQRALLRKGHQFALAIFKRQSDGLRQGWAGHGGGAQGGRGAQEAAPACRQQGRVRHV